MIQRTFNKLWVHFSLSIIGILIVVTVLPAASLLLADPQDVVRDARATIQKIGDDTPLALSAQQIDILAGRLAIETQQSQVEDIRFLLLTTLIVGIVGGVLLGRGLSRPVERLVEATQAVGSRDLAHQVTVKGAQEIQELAVNFNQMTAELARSEQLRQNMMADVSHELLTPLTVLQGNLRAILDDVYALSKDEIGRLYEQNKHLIRLVKDLRLLAQAEAGQMTFKETAVSLETLTAETTAIFMPAAAEKSIHIQHDFAGNLPSIQADANRLRQVLHNLLANALRHTPAGGQIMVCTNQAGHEVCLSIIDNGEGIPPELQPHLFDRFSRSEAARRRDSGGVGLGLAISKAIVLALNGRIQATSPGKGQGSTFTICFPLEEGD